ncbi:hypothetical protein GCM10018789_25010 [Streptomyces werraensis]|nr:hypothetical protein GCM10018789_25010 [Streptomyces werraensis]
MRIVSMGTPDGQGRVFPGDGPAAHTPGGRARRTARPGHDAPSRRPGAGRPPGSPLDLGKEGPGVGRPGVEVMEAPARDRHAEDKTTRTDASHVAENTARRAIPGRKLPACR